MENGRDAFHLWALRRSSNPCAKDHASLLHAPASQLAMFYANPESPPPPDDLYSAMRDIALRPLRTLVPPWSWKAAALSALLRGITFYLSNLRSGHQKALLAMIVEAGFAVFAAGLIGAISQRLRASRPAWATAAVVCLGLLALMVITP